MADRDKKAMPDNRLIFVYPQGGVHLERVRDGMLVEVMCYFK
jgi:hypothetical protein